MLGQPPESDSFDVQLPDGFDPGERLAALKAAAKTAGWSLEHVGAIWVVRGVRTENQDHAAWLVAKEVGLPMERVTVWAGQPD